MKHYRYALLTILLLHLAEICFGANYLLPNEQVIFSFQTKNSKQVFLVKDKQNKYIVYRFGTPEKIEFEYPETKADSWNKFEYTFYQRGGGLQNEGMELNYVSFINKGFRYIIYDTYYARGKVLATGIRIKNLQSAKTMDIPGIYKTRKGTLIDFRDNNLLKIGEELYD